MRLAIMQPYFFPYPGYFSLIKHTDKFIILDMVQFIRHGWIERNRILKQDSGWLYVKVPLTRKEGRDTLIKDLRIDNTQDWKQRIMAQLQTYRKIAPFYNQVRTLLEEIFSIDYEDIVQLDKRTMEAVCDYLGITHDIQVFSEMGLQINTPAAPDEWALNIALSLGGVKEYWNPPGGRSFFDGQKYMQAGIDLKFLELRPASYNQHRDSFESGLSIIDALMFNSVQQVREILDDFIIHDSSRVDL